MGKTSIVILAICLMAASASATVYTVRPDGSGDYPTIEAAVNAAVAGDVVELTDGVFTGLGNKDVSYAGKAITIRSATGDPAACIVDCEGEGRGFRMTTGEGPDTVLEGITIRNGDVEAIGGNGGGLLAGQSCSAIIRNCHFLNNRAELGGAAIFGAYSQPQLIDCRFEGNAAWAGGAVLHWNEGRLVVTGCEFIENEGGWGGGIAFSSWTYDERGMPRPGAQRAGEPDLRVIRELLVADCSFIDNESLHYSGGGIFFGAEHLLVEDSSFIGNNGDGWAEGGAGINFWWSDAIRDEIRGCTFARNSADENGFKDIDVSFGCNLLVEDCNFVGRGDGRPFYFRWDCTSTEIEMRCCLIYDYTDNWQDCIVDQLGINGNIEQDPLLCDPDSDDLGVDATSPCLPANNECGVRIGVFGEGCAIYGNVYLVRPDGTGDFPTIQAAIDAAINYDVIELADGVFSGPGNVDVNYHGLPITIRSLSGNPADCIIDGSADSGGIHRGFYFNGNESRLAILDGVTIRNCNATGDGGAIVCWYSGPTIRNCVIYDCEADRGGGIHLWENRALIENCTVVGNHSRETYGSGIYVYSGWGDIEGTIVAFNTGALGLDFRGSNNPEVRCTVVFGNEGGDWVGDAAEQLGVDGNSARDPLFCDLAAGDLKLDADSPCLPSASDCGGLIGALGQGCDVPTHSISGRIEDDSGAPVPGALLDAGLYHFHPSASGEYRMDVRPGWGGRSPPL